LIVVDASAMVDSLVWPGAAAARLADEALCAPHLLDAEVGSSFRNLTLSGEQSTERAGGLLDDFRSIEVLRYAHDSLVGRAWQLRANLTFYDALYVALAETLELPLVTLDRRLAGAPGVRAVVEALPPGAPPEQGNGNG
jgi:predicted nucleic acid-binding protein